MTIFSNTWNVAFDQSPADTDDAGEGALRVRQTRVAAKERIAVDHKLDGDANDGKHKKVTLVSQAGDPTLDTGDGSVYGRTINGVLELFFKDSTGRVIQITSGGQFNLGALPSSLADADTLDGQDGSFYQNSSNQNAGTLPLARLPATLTGKDADTLDGQHGDYYRDVPAGARAFFYQASAPSGWELDSSLNDRVLRVVSSGGANVGGTWVISGLNVHGHALSTAEMPPHQHQSGVTVRGGVGGQSPPFGSVPRGDIDWEHHFFHANNLMPLTQSVGSGASHDHGISQDGGWRPSHANVIMCTRQ